MGVFTVKKQGTRIVERINWFSLKKILSVLKLNPPTSKLDSRFPNISRIEVPGSSFRSRLTFYQLPLPT